MEMRLTGTPDEVGRAADWLTRRGKIAGMTVAGLTRHTGGGQPGESCTTLIVTVADPEPEPAPPAVAYPAGPL
jgi:hypothetical protein